MPTPKGAGRPYYNPAPSIATSIAQGGRFRTPSQTDLRDWQDVISSDENLQMLQSPEERTNYLRAVWGLPNTYKIDAQGNIVDRNNVILRNLYWIGPAAIVASGAIPALAAGGGGAGAAGAAQGAGGVLPASSPFTAAGINAIPPTLASQGASAGLGALAATSPYTAAGTGAVPPTVASQGVSRGIKAGLTGAEIARQAAGGGGGGNAGGLGMGDVLKAIGKYLPAGIAGIAAGKSLFGEDPTAKTQEDIRRILGLAEGRITASEPLFQALNAMAMAQLPKFARGEQ